MLIPASSPSRQRGITLVEVLIAMLVMSVGMLGIAGLQAATSKYQLATRMRSLTAPLLSDISGRMRSNAVQAGSNAFTSATDTSSYVLSSDWAAQQSATLTITKDCETDTVDCTAAERATYDMAIWRQRVRSTMPQGAALLEGDRSMGITVTFMWFDKDQTDKGSNSNSALQKAPVCSTSDETAGSNRMGLQNCCPTQANAPAGVRCNRFTFIP
jgi:type IV pilus assembly protein PilV